MFKRHNFHLLYSSALGLFLYPLISSPLVSFILANLSSVFKSTKWLCGQSDDDNIRLRTGSELTFNTYSDLSLSLPLHASEPLAVCVCANVCVCVCGCPDPLIGLNTKPVTAKKQPVTTQLDTTVHDCTTKNTSRLFPSC